VIAMEYELSPLDEMLAITPHRVLGTIMGSLSYDETFIVLNKKWFEKAAKKKEIPEEWPKAWKELFEVLLKHKDEIMSAKSDVVQILIRNDSIASIRDAPEPLQEIKGFAIVKPEFLEVYKEDEKALVIKPKERKLLGFWGTDMIFGEVKDFIGSALRSTSEGVRKSEAKPTLEKVIDEVSAIGSRVEEETATIYESIITSLGRGVVPATTSAGFFKIIREVEKRVSEISDNEIRNALTQVKDLLAEEIANVVKTTKVVIGATTTTLKDALNLDDAKLKEYAMKEAEKLINDMNFRTVVAAGVYKIKKGEAEYSENPKVGLGTLGSYLGEAYVYAVRLRGYATADILAAESDRLGLNSKHLTDYMQSKVQETRKDIPLIKQIYEMKEAQAQQKREEEEEESVVSASA